MIEEYFNMLQNWFSMDNVLFEFMGQKISYLEGICTLT